MDVLAHDRDTHVVFFKVENQPEDIAGKFHQFQGHHLVETVDPGDTVTDRQDHAGFAEFDLLVIIGNLLFDNLTNFFSS